MTKRFDDYYSLLGVPRLSTQEEIRRAYLKAAKRLHPDKNVKPGETAMFLDVHQAYDVLSNPDLRAAYDATLQPEKPARPIIKSRVLASRKTLSPLNQTQLFYLLIDLAPSEEFIATSGYVPLNLCLVLDCSTSMKDEKLDKVKATAIQLIRRLKPQDIFSVVTFNDRAEVTIPAIRQANLLRMENRIHLLQASGGTEILQGLKAGLDEVIRYKGPEYINHIILLTDGHTYGDEEACYALAKEAAQSGIGISGMGIGNDWNDNFLDKLAKLTGGHSMLVSHPQDIERLLNEKFVNLTNTFAESVTLEYELGQGVEINNAFRLQPESNSLECENPLRMGPILHTSLLSVLLEFVIHPQTEDRDLITLMQGNLHVSVNSLDTEIPLIPINIVLPIKKQSDQPEVPPAPIIQALSKLQLYNMQEKARIEMEAGNYTKATEHLQRLAVRLLAQGQRSLANTIIFEINNIETDKTYSEQGKKQIKYGTRALLLTEEKNT